MVHCAKNGRTLCQNEGVGCYGGDGLFQTVMKGVACLVPPTVERISPTGAPTCDNRGNPSYITFKWSSSHKNLGFSGKLFQTVNARLPVSRTGYDGIQDSDPYADRCVLRLWWSSSNQLTSSSCQSYIYLFRYVHTCNDFSTVMIRRVR